MTYTYKCLELECGEQFNIEKGINEDIEVKCIGCGSENIQRVFAPIGTVVNCTGFCGKINK